MKKTIAQQLNIKDFPFIIKDNKGNEIYYEDYDKFWKKYLYDSKGNEINYKDSDGFWHKYQYDSKGNIIYYEDSYGYWSKRKYDDNDNEIYYENSYGKIIDNRPKEVILSMDEIAEKFGINVKDLKVKK